MWKWFLVSLSVIILDQLTKGIASTQLTLFQPVAIFPGFNFTLMHNQGAAFSFLSNAGGWQRWFFTGLAIIVSFAIIAWVTRLKPEEKWTALSLTMILGGALGNLIDRMRMGYVVDFIDVYYKTAHWPAFNIADSAITVGATIMIIASLKTRNQKVSEKSD